jgi:hypothetical protein
MSLRKQIKNAGAPAFLNRAGAASLIGTAIGLSYGSLGEKK